VAESDNVRPDAQADRARALPPQDGWIRPGWPAPAKVRAVSTTRLGGTSRGPYAAFNLADHVGDVPGAVASNRSLLMQRLALPAEPSWLQQVHGRAVVPAQPNGAPREADASFSLGPGAVCAVLTADCLPVLLCDRDGARVAAAHAGWRGLAAGVLEAAVEALQVPGARLMAWLGPAIGPRNFEVGDEVRAVFLAHDSAAAPAFRPSPAGRWLADLYILARQRLAETGVTEVYGGGLCTFSDQRRFYSYRRDGTTGRMATLIWLAS
jgi:YfiH family protein